MEFLLREDVLAGQKQAKGTEKMDCAHRTKGAVLTGLKGQRRWTLLTEHRLKWQRRWILFTGHAGLSKGGTLQSCDRHRIKEQRRHFTRKTDRLNELRRQTQANRAKNCSQRTDTS